MTHPRIEKTAFLALLLAAVPALAAHAPAWVESEVKAAESDLTALRHKLHAVGTKNAPTAVLGILNPEKKDTILLRADIDALPIKERTGLPYASQVKGTYWAAKAWTSPTCADMTPTWRCFSPPRRFSPSTRRTCPAA